MIEIGSYWKLKPASNQLLWLHWTVIIFTCIECLFLVLFSVSCRYVGDRQIIVSLQQWTREKESKWKPKTTSNQLICTALDKYTVDMCCCMSDLSHFCRSDFFCMSNVCYWLLHLWFHHLWFHHLWFHDFTGCVYLLNFLILAHELYQ